MSQDPRLFSPVFSIDVCTDPHTAAASTKIDANELIVNLLKQLVEGQQQEMKFLAEIAHWVGLSHKQRAQEITSWKEANPDLARSCRIASEALLKVQNDYIHKLTEEAADGYETMMDSEFMCRSSTMPSTERAESAKRRWRDCWRAAYSPRNSG